MTHRVLKERFIGAILGCAVGDALGAPFEGVGANKLFQDGVPDYAQIAGFPPGQYTDDTQMTLAIVKAVLEDGEIGGRSVAEKFAELWRSGEIVGPGASCSEAMRRYIRGDADWDECGTAPGRAGNGTAMRAGPIGLWDYDAPERLVKDAAAVSIITHKDERAVAGAIAVAAAVAYVVQRDKILTEDFVGHVSQGVSDHSAEFARAVDKVPALMKADEADAIRTIINEGWKGHDTSFGVTPFVVPTVLASFYAFLKHPDDFCAAVRTVINMGGDVDSTGAITGAISGAFNGVYAIPERLREGVKDSGMIHDLAAELFHKKAGGSLSE
jgi:ADP-ribosyl-[dinitrogen reductase] hydrolase